MSKNIEHLQHIKSNVVIEGKPKLPTAEVLVDGELAVNYAEGYETISLRNSNSGITTFSSDDYYTKNKLGSGFTGVNSANTVTSVIEENEEIISSALNDLDERKLDASAYTPTDLSNYYTKTQTSGASELEEAFSGKADSDYVEEIELVTAAALNDLEGRKLDASAYTPTDLSNYYTKDETSGATEISNALGAKVNSQTFIAHTADTNVHVTSEEKTLWNAKADKSWVEEKLGSGFTGDNSANTVTSVIEENEEIVASALNDLESRKLDASAYTPTDLSNYYTKSETSGATEISAALNGYADSVKYNSTAHTVEFYHGTTGGTKVFEFDASAFIVDGMVDNVEVDDVVSGSSTIKCLVISFNTDAGKQDINIPISDIFNPDFYYTKDEIDNSELVISSALNDLESRKLDASAYTPTDLTNYYTKSQTSGATEISTALGTKENAFAIDSTTKTSSFSAEVGTYYIVNVPNDGSVTVTLPTSNMSSTNVQNIIFLVTLDSGALSIAFTPITFKSEGFNNMTAGNTYEVNALWNGNDWIMAMTKLEAV